MNQQLTVRQFESFAPAAPSRRTTLAYRALVFFSFVYFFRRISSPDWCTSTRPRSPAESRCWPWFLGSNDKTGAKLPLEGKILLVLFAHLILTIPTAFWRGGSFDTVVNRFSKGVIVALLISLVVTKMSELRKLLYIQASAVAVITVWSLIAHHTVDGRLMGIQKGILENPNDLAINIAINFPLCMALLFAAKGGLRKVIWGLGLFCLLYGVVATYSRSGMIAMAIAVLMCLYEFGIRGKRFSLLAAAVIFGVFAVGGLVASPRYLGRILSLVRRPDPGSVIQGTMESHGEGSLEARTLLLKESLSFNDPAPVIRRWAGKFPRRDQIVARRA